MLKHSHDQGFTLVELMMTIAVFAILVSLGAPFMGEFVKNSRLVTQTNDLIASFHLARTEAIKRGTRVTLCKSSNGATCNATADGRWGIGWITFVDLGAVGTWDVPPNVGEVLIDTRAATPLNVAIAPQAADAAVQNYVSYTAQGTVRDAAGTAQNGTFRICDDRGVSKGRGVVLSRTGRVELINNAQFQLSIGTCPS